MCFIESVNPTISPRAADAANYIMVGMTLPRAADAAEYIMIRWCFPALQVRCQGNSRVTPPSTYALGSYRSSGHVSADGHDYGSG